MRTMQQRVRGAVPAVGWLVVSAWMIGMAGPLPNALAAPGTYALARDASQLRVVCKSTLHDFTIQPTEWGGRLRFDPDTWTVGTPTEVSVVVGGLLSGNPKRDKAMWRMFSADEYPGIRFAAHRVVFDQEAEAVEARLAIESEAEAAGVDAAETAAVIEDELGVFQTADWRYGRLEGTLTIRDIPQPVSIPVTIRRLDDGIEVNGSVPVALAPYHLKPPTVLGLIRVKPEVTVEFASRWTKDGSS